MSGINKRYFPVNPMAFVHKSLSVMSGECGFSLCKSQILELPLVVLCVLLCENVCACAIMLSHHTQPKSIFNKGRCRVCYFTAQCGSL